MSQQTNRTRDYYQHAELELPANSNFHQFRMRLNGDKWLRVRDTVRTTEDLRHWLIKLVPTDVYHSANEFLSPSSMSYTEFDGKKAGWNISNNILLGDGVILVDTDFHIRPFNEAKKDALMVHDYFRERGYVVGEIKMTGQGFQLLVIKHDLFLPQIHPKARFNLYREKRKPILEDLQQRGVQVDAEILLDAKRITRTVRTVNSKNGVICQAIRDLERFEESDVERVFGFEGSAPTSSKRGAMTNFFLTDKKAVDSRWRRSERTHRTNAKPSKADTPTNQTPTIYLSSHVIRTNRTPATIRQVVMLSFRQTEEIMADENKRNLVVENLKKRLSAFAISKKLAPFIILRSKKDTNNFYAISPTAVEGRGIKRLLKRFPRDNSTYQRFRRRLVPMPLVYVAQTFGDTNSEIPVSASHYKYLRHYGLLADFVPKVLCGSPNLLSTPIGEMNS